MESGSFESGRRAMPEKWVCHLIVCGLDRITLYNFGALTRSQLHCCANQVGGESLAAVPLFNKETGNGPHWLFVYRLENSRTLQCNVVLPWGDCAPADWFFADVGDNSRLPATGNDAAQTSLVCVAFSGVKLFSRHAPKHAPAPCAGAALAEELFNVPPTGRGGAMGSQLLQV
jgi:hypothetical protein